MSANVKTSIGGSPAFPVPHDSAWCGGMTYRQWLVGMIAGSYRINPNNRTGEARDIVDMADAIINQLDKEAQYQR